MELPVLVQSDAVEERKRCAEIGVVRLDSDGESGSESDREDPEGPGQKTRPLSKDDMMLLPPLPSPVLSKRNVSVEVEVEEVEELMRTPGAENIHDQLGETEHIAPMHGLGVGLAFAPPPEITLEDMSLALDVRDYMDSPSSTTFNSHIFDTMSSNASLNILDVSSMVSSSPKVAPQPCIIEPVGVPLDPMAHSHTHLLEPKRKHGRMFSLASPAATSPTRGLGGRSRSLSNSNILRKLSLGSLTSSRNGSVGSDAGSAVANTLGGSPVLPSQSHRGIASSPIAEEGRRVRHPRSGTNATTPRRRRAATFVVASVTPEEELRKWPAVQFSNDAEQSTYVRSLVDQQTRDDLSFDVALRHLAQDAWQSQTEVVTLQQQRIRLNSLWARKITHYQG